VRIHYLSAQGVLEVEQGALRELERSLPSAWMGFAAFRLLARGSKLPLDIDLLILTPNRVLVVELKNWAGDIEYSAGQWIHKGAPKKSPVEVNDNKVRVLKGFIRDKDSALAVPFIENLVVLCHPQCRLVRFPDEEKRFVMTLADFCYAASDPGRYRAKFPDTPFGQAYRSKDPLPERQKYERIFTSRTEGILQRRMVLHGFEQTDSVADYEHPRKIWAEFRAQHRENRGSKALLRKWNFQELAGGGASSIERQTIGLRELRLNEMLRVQAPELHADLLEPVGSAEADDITTNFVEAYRLPSSIERLAEHLSRQPDMPIEERRSLALSILARFAKLHTLGIAHRDITKKTLWVMEPARVILSTFAAARVPEALTVGVHRFELETGSIDLPEDAGGSPQKAINDPFARDVFLLGVLVYEMLESQELERVNRVPLYDTKRELKLASLAPWYERAMDWDPTARYRSAVEALDALNECLTVESGPTVSEADFETYATAASPFTLPMKEQVSSIGAKMVYLSEREGVKVLVKCWTNLKYDPKYGSRNIRLLGFLQRARSLRQSGFDAAPEVIDFGVGQFGLILVTRWVEGVTLGEWLGTKPTDQRRAAVTLSLFNAVCRLHALGLSHGDLKADNIAICRAEGSDDERAVLLDVPDLNADGDEGLTIGSVPPAMESASPKHRDLYAVTRIGLELLSEEFPNTRRDAERALEIDEAPPPVELFAETLKTELTPPAVDITPTYLVLLRRRGRDVPAPRDLDSNNGEFSVGVIRDEHAGEQRFIVSGVRQQMVIKYDLFQNVAIDASLRDIGHQDFVSAYKRRSFALRAKVRVAWHDVVDASALGEDLYQLYLDSRPEFDEREVGWRRPATDPYAEGASRATELRQVSAGELWSALASTDEMNGASITVRAGARQVPEGSGHWLIPFDLERGVLDFSEDERIELLERGVDPMDGEERWYTVGVVASDIGKDVIRVQQTSFRFRPKEGMSLFLRGALERSASERRVAAMKRVLSGGALIPKIVEYFDPDAELMPHTLEVGELGDLSEYALNPQQEEALRTALSFGPVSLLQGPPGTGKTKFIASFVDLVLARGLASNVLLVSQSHEAVNNAMEKVLELSRKNGKRETMVRIGLPSMVSQLLRPIQEDALRQRYRETFDAEIKQRLRAVGYSMGLPKQYVQTAVELHTSLGALLERIAHLERTVSGTAAGEEGSGVHVQRLREVFAEIASTRFGIEVSSTDDLSAALDDELADLAAMHDSPSPAKCERLGQLALLSSEFSQVLRNPRSNFTAFLARSASVVAGTCVGIGKHALGIVDLDYDWVIVDEAARASPMELVVAMQAGKRVLLVGDHLQLPPIYPMAVEESAAQLLGIPRSEFRRINNFQRAFSSSYGKAVGRTLLRQYRMAASINQVVSHCFYRDALQVGREAPGPEYEELPEFLSKQVIWVDTSDQGRGAYHRSAGTHEGALENEAEAVAVIDVVRSIAKSGSFLQRVRELEGDREPPIGIIAMYAAQRDLIRRKLEQADWASEIRDLYSVGTVDSYQGKENRIIILSVVRNDSSRSIGFLTDPERINVAMSRAKDRLIIVSSTAMWDSHAKTPMHSVLAEVRRLQSMDDASILASRELRLSTSHA
jgi:serine/threonine protein kinase